MAAELDQSVVDTAKAYVQVLRNHEVPFESAWLFGSHARNVFDEDSDIDIAVVMQDVVEGKFFKELELMRYRRQVDSRIEPHVLSAGELDTPFASEIMRTGVKIN